MPKIQKKKTKSSNVLKFSFTETLNDPHPKKDEKNDAMKSTCVSRFDLISSVKTSHGLKHSAQDS